ncbi:MAG: sensor histidine kinase [Ilumatobacter sp.]|nr:sensor histidine kinase [Ilumatobacter sp.]
MTWPVVLAVVLLGAAAGWMLRARLGDTPPERPSVAALSPAFATADPPPAAAVIDALRLGVAMSGKDGAGEFRNTAAQTMTAAPDHVALDDAIERHLARGLAGLRSNEVVELDTSPKSVYVVHSTPLTGGGSVVFVDDISERRRIDAVRTDFVANVSHELKTPIGAISVLAETLQDERDLATVQRLAGRLLAEAERAASTIDDLMELSRIEMGGDRETGTVSIAALIHEALRRVGEVAEQRGVSVSVSGDDRLDVSGDHRQLVSAVGNLVENAVKYSHEGGTVEIEFVGDAESVIISVADHGIGIPATDVGRVFERFYRVDPARSRATGGTGLGLAIVRHVATQHDGRVVVDSVEGVGSTFSLWLPRTGRRRDELG